MSKKIIDGVEHEVVDTLPGGIEFASPWRTDDDGYPYRILSNGVRQRGDGSIDRPDEPVELDPPDPALTRWQELAERDISIDHGGDAEKVIPFPRPAWADPDSDIIGPTQGRCYYTSEWVDVALRHRTGAVGDEILAPASVRLRAKVDGTGLRVIGMSTWQVANGKWMWSEGVGLSPAEALELANVLRAAVDLLGETE